ncbi:hypothetical protein DBV15_07072, partial [Temnothorax longispinosus]
MPRYKSFQVAACNLIQLKNQPDISGSQSSNLTKTNRLSIIQHSTNTRASAVETSSGHLRRRENRVTRQSPGNETSRKPRAERDAITERNAVFISRLILDGVIRRGLFRRRSRAVLAKSQKMRQKCVAERTRWTITERVDEGGKRGRKIACKWKIVIGRFDDAARCTRNYEGARSFVLMKAVEWKLRLRSTSLIHICLQFSTLIPMINLVLSAGASLEELPQADDNGSTLHPEEDGTNHEPFTSLEPSISEYKYFDINIPQALEGDIKFQRINHEKLSPFAAIGAKSARAKSLRAVERELTVRGVHTSRCPVFSTSRVQRADNPFRLAAFARLPNGYWCIRHCEVRGLSYLAKEAFRICTDSERHSPTRPSINNTPIYAVSSRSLRSDTRDRAVVAVYYTTLNWHQWLRESGKMVFIAGRLIDRLDCVANSFGNESTDKMDVTSLYSPSVLFLPHPIFTFANSARYLDLRDDRRNGARHGTTWSSRSDDIIVTESISTSIRVFKSARLNYVAISDDRSGTDSRSTAQEWSIKQNIPEEKIKMTQYDRWKETSLKSKVHFKLPPTNGISHMHRTGLDAARSKTKRNEHSALRERAASQIPGTCLKSFGLEESHKHNVSFDERMNKSPGITDARELCEIIETGTTVFRGILTVIMWAKHATNKLEISSSDASSGSGLVVKVLHHTKRFVSPLSCGDSSSDYRLMINASEWGSYQREITINPERGERM